MGAGHKLGTPQVNSSDGGRGVEKVSMPMELEEPVLESMALEKSRVPREGFALVGGSAVGGRF